MKGSSVHLATMKGSSVHLAQMKGSSVHLAKMKGSSVHLAKMIGSSVHLAKIKGSSVHLAKMKGSSVRLARMKGSSVHLARMKGSSVHFLPTILQGCVLPLLEVALHVGPPSLSMLCIMSPCYTLQLYQVVSPSLTLSSPRSSALSWLPLGYSLCPTIII